MGRRVLVCTHHPCTAEMLQVAVEHKATVAFGLTSFLPPLIPLIPLIHTTHFSTSLSSFHPEPLPSPSLSPFLPAPL